MSKVIEIIEKEILSWPYVTAEPHRFGGVEFHLNKREMGHIHSEGLADIPFPMKTRDELINAGLVKPHHVLPQSGWVSYWFHNSGEKEDIATVIDLFKLRYELLKSKAQTKSDITVIPSKQN
jgi:Family of unknown function (DUF5519)